MAEACSVSFSNRRGIRTNMPVLQQVYMLMRGWCIPGCKAGDPGHGLDLSKHYARTLDDDQIQKAYRSSP